MESTLEMLNESLLQNGLVFLVQDHGMNGRRLRTPMDKYHLEPQGQPFINGWKWWFPTIFYIKIWNHPTETSIYKWLALGFQAEAAL